jgi:hypothetical protein
MYAVGDFSRGGLEVIVEEDLESGLLPGQPTKQRRCKEKCWDALIYFLIGLNVLGLIGLLIGFILWLVLQK